MAWGLGLVGLLVSVDLFCGGGGASLGIQQAAGKAPAVAVNHCPHAIEMHTVNHPETVHFEQSVYDVAPGTCVPGRMVDLLWASPDCTHHSRAKGGKPRKKSIRALANVVVTWAQDIRPKVLMLENVPEFVDWGPLYPETHHIKSLRGKPIKSRKGELFDEWVEELELLGYVVEWRKLRACDYGTPTIRQRLFLIARSDGIPITWPAPTHGEASHLKPFRTAAECIDWSIPALSIFADKSEAKAWAQHHGMRGVPRRPLADKTQRRIAEGIRRFVLQGKPFILDIANQGGRGKYVYDTDESMRTVTTKASHCVVQAGLVNTRNGERKGQAPRVRDLNKPALTITAQGSQGAVAAAHLMKVAYLAKHNGGKHGAIGQKVADPMHTITSTDTKAVVEAHLSKTGNSKAVAAFLLKYYGSGSQWSGADEPMHTIVSKARMGLVTVDIDGETYAITDITMRMLTPRELATAQGFPQDYVLTGSKKDQIARIGNSVCPPVVKALVESNFGGPGCPLAQPDRFQQMPMYGYRYDLSDDVYSYDEEVA